MYFVVAGRVFIYKRNGKFEVLKFRASSRSHIFKEVIFLQSDEGLYYLYKNKLGRLPFTKAFTFKNFGIIQVIPFKENKLLIITRQGGLFIYDAEFLFNRLKNGKEVSEAKLKKENILASLPSKADKYLKEKGLYTAIKIRDDLFAIALYESKFLLINDKGKVLRIGEESRGLQNEIILGFFLDREKNLWLALNRGFSYIELNSPYTFLDKRYGLKNMPHDLLVKGDTVYVSAMDGVFYLNLCGKKDGNEKYMFKKLKGTGFDSFDLRRIGNKVFATGSGGVFVIVKDRAKKVFGDAFFYCVGYSPKFSNTVFAGNMGALSAYIFDKSSWKSGSLEKFESFRFKEVKSIIRELTTDKNGNLWLSTEKDGVGYIEFYSKKDLRKYRFFKFGEENGLPSKVGNMVFKVGNEIWVVGKDDHVYKKIEKIERGKRKFYFVENDEVNKFLKRNAPLSVIYEDDYGNVWVGQTGNLFLLKKDKNGKYIKVANYLKEVNEEISVIFRKNNYLWVGTTEGVYRLNLNLKREFDINLHTLLTKVVINNSENYFNGTFFIRRGKVRVPVFSQPPSFIPTLPYKRNSLYFEFSLPFYTHKEGNRYSYKLEGYDKEWSGWVGFTKKEYTNLPPGDYVFRVKAKNIFGMVTKEARFRFTILPPWYMTWYAYFFYFILGAFFVYLILLFNNKRHLKAKERLEKIIKERTAEIERQKKKLEELATHDGLTGVYNKRKFNEVFNHEWKRAERNGRYLGILMVDVDFF